MRLATVTRHGRARFVAERPEQAGQLIDVQLALDYLADASGRADLRLAGYGTAITRFLAGGDPAMAAAAEALELTGGLPAEQLQRRGLLMSSDEVEFSPVAPAPQRILCVGRNYRAHAEETGRAIPDHPIFFVRFPSSLVGHRQPLIVPAVSERLDWEGELAVVIGRPARHLKPQDAASVIAGYSIFNDGSVRDYQHHGTQWTAGKNFAASGSFGPYLVTADEVGNPADLTVVTRVNGAVMQEASTAGLIFGIPELLAYITQWQALEPGDVIATGTPAGIGNARKPPVFLRAGDEVTVSIDTLGRLVNPVADEQDDRPEGA
jgi:2-keto-4-pentenoate hydratase/2-oxohepta-3-ene-1,7-dioic acid hydratase in catechol pathway